MTIILQILSQPKNDSGVKKGQDLVRYMKLEAGWILTNLATTEQAEELNLILNFQSSNNLSFVLIINMILIQNNDDLPMIDQILFLMGNICESSSSERTLVRTKFNLISLISAILKSHTS